MRRNGETVGAIARACREAGSRLVLISTNEEFPRRTPRRPRLPRGRPHRPAQPVRGLQARGASRPRRRPSVMRRALYRAHTACLWASGPRLPRQDHPQPLTSSRYHLAWSATSSNHRPTCWTLPRPSGSWRHVWTGTIHPAQRRLGLALRMGERRARGAPPGAPGRSPSPWPVPTRIRTTPMGHPRHLPRCGRRRHHARLAGRPTEYLLQARSE